jgi:hypothetical protein
MSAVIEPAISAPIHNSALGNIPKNNECDLPLFIACVFL